LSRVTHRRLLQAPQNGRKGREKPRFEQIKKKKEKEKKGAARETTPHKAVQSTVCPRGKEGRET